jgi:hypothetical protein
MTERKMLWRGLSSPLDDVHSWVSECGRAHILQEAAEGETEGRVVLYIPDYKGDGWSVEDSVAGAMLSAELMLLGHGPELSLSDRWRTPEEVPPAT